MSTSMRKWLVDQWRADQVTRGRCEGRVCEAHLKLTAPCHNCSYLSVGGEWISSMNNRLSLIFLGEPRLPISQLISEFSLLLIYRRILSRDWEWGGRGGGEDYSILWAFSSLRWRRAKCWVVLQSHQKCQREEERHLWDTPRIFIRKHKKFREKHSGIRCRLLRMSFIQVIINCVITSKYDWHSGPVLAEEKWTLVRP